MRVSTVVRLTVLAIATPLMMSLVGADNTYADNRNPYNVYEQRAKNACTGTDRRGAIWFTNLPGSYYGDSNGVINIGENDSSITVYIRGSVYNCNSTSRSGVGAKEVYPSGANAWRMTGLSGGEFSRGTSQGKNNWSTQGDHITASLNVSGLATNNLGRVDSESITIGIHRRFWNRSNGSTGTADIEYVTVTIRRAARPIVWSVSGVSTINKTTAVVGDTLSWTHRLINNGPNSTNQNIYSNLGMSGIIRPGWSTGVNGATIGNPAGVGTIRSITSSTANYTMLTVDESDIGKTLCEWVQWDPVNSSGGRDGRSSPACANIVYVYSLTPNTIVPASSVVPGGSVRGISSSINNSASTKAITDSSSAVVRFVLPRGSGSLAKTTAGTTTLSSNINYPCDLAGVVANGEANCKALAQNSSGQKFSSGDTSIYAGADDLSNLPLQFGDRICYLTVVNRYDNNHTSILDWRYSAPICIPVNKIPSVQIFGSDARVGSGLTPVGGNAASKIAGISQLSSDDARYYGSWSEYGLIAPSTIAGVASGSGFSNGTASSSQADWSKFTFANKLTYGRFATSPADLGTLPSVASDIGDFSFDTIITGGSIGAWPGGKSVLVRNIGGAVTITGNINKPTGYAGLADMPQMIIVADDIVINSNVTNVDAWLVAKNTIKTCNVDIATQLTASQCNQQLRINGPVMANKLFLLRTFGADSPATLNTPAEIIDLRADTYMWVRYQAELTGGLRTAYTREMPPRY